MEPPVRQRYLALLSVFASLPAMALTYQTRLENIEWTVEGDKFECRLSQPVTDFGSGPVGMGHGEVAEFVQKDNQSQPQHRSDDADDKAERVGAVGIWPEMLLQGLRKPRNIGSRWAIRPARWVTVSPKPTMPPQHTLIPASRTRSSVSRRSW